MANLNCFGLDGLWNGPVFNSSLVQLVMPGVVQCFLHIVFTYARVEFLQ